MFSFLVFIVFRPFSRTPSLFVQNWSSHLEVSDYAQTCSSCVSVLRVGIPSTQAGNLGDFLISSCLLPPAWRSPFIIYTVYLLCLHFSDTGLAPTCSLLAGLLLYNILIISQSPGLLLIPLLPGCPFEICKIFKNMQI